MNQEILMEIGRVVYINYGPLVGKLAVVLELINKNRVIISGPGLGVPRSVITIRRIELTKFKIPNVQYGVKEGELKKAIDSFKLLERFNKSSRGQKILNSHKRSQLGDFDRFKVTILKRKLAKASRTQINKLKKSLKK